MTHRDKKKKVRGWRLFFLSAAPTAEKRNLNGQPFSKRTPYVSRVTEFIVRRRLSCCARTALGRGGALGVADRGVQAAHLVHVVRVVAALDARLEVGQLVEDQVLGARCHRPRRRGRVRPRG